MQPRPLALVFAALLVTASCGGDDGSGTATSDVTTDVAPTTTEATTVASAPPTTAADATPATAPPTNPPATDAPAETAPPVTEPVEELDLAEPGPHPVGATTLRLGGDGPEVEVWYPAVEGTTGTVQYDVRDFTPPAIRELLTGDVVASFAFDGARDVAVAEGTHPVVLFSHGFSGFRLQSTFLTSHLASHGMIVVAPDHPSRDLANNLGGTATGDRESATAELLASLDLIVAAGEDAGGPFEGRVDADRVAALGHSAGGGTVLAAAFDERLSGYVSMASGGPGDDGEMPPAPSLFLAGSTDAIVPPAERTRPAFERAATPSWYVEIADTGHNGFADFCTFGGGTGIIGVAEASGLGPVLDAQPQLRALGEDGCVPPAAPVDQAFPIVRFGTTAFLRWVLEIDTSEPALTSVAFEPYDLDVVVEERR